MTKHEYLKDGEDLYRRCADKKGVGPDHYKQGDIECIDYIKSVLSKEGYIGYLQGNITKYLHRWKDKNGVEDLDKAHVYLNWLIEEVEKDA